MAAQKINSCDLGFAQLGDLIATGGVALPNRTLLIGTLFAVHHTVSEQGPFTYLSIKLLDTDEPIVQAVRDIDLWIGDDLLDVTRSVLAEADANEE